MVILEECEALMYSSEKMQSEMTPTYFLSFSQISRHLNTFFTLVFFLFVRPSDGIIENMNK